MSAEATPTTHDEFTKEEREYHVERIKKMQRDFHDWLNRKKRLSEQERQCLAQRDFTHATDYWTKLSKDAKEKFDGQHDTGWRHGAKSAQTIAAAAGRFLNNFKPLVEFASNANPFGGLAVGAISCLFAIAQSKSETDDAVAIAMAGMTDRLPGYRMLQEVYNERNPHQGRLRKKILIAYSGVIELAIASAKYYLKPGITRWWLATWNSEKFTVLADRVHGYAVAVVMQQEELLTWAVNEIREGAKKQARIIDQQTSKLDQLQEDSNRYQLRYLVDLLGISDWSPKEQQEELGEYERTLKRTREDSRPFQWMDTGSVAEYRISKDVKEWKVSQASSMLLVIGVNHEGMPRGEHCWVSPLALDLIKSAQTSDVALAYYVFDFKIRSSMHTAMRILLLQLLKLQKRPNVDTLSPQLEKYRNELSSTGGSGNDNPARKTLEKIAVTIIQLIEPRQVVWIVVDRVDRCEEREQRHLLSVLVRLLEGARCCLKIFAVANKRNWNVAEFQMQQLAECPSFKTITETQRQPDDD